MKKLNVVFNYSGIEFSQEMENLLKLCYFPIIS